MKYPGFIGGFYTASTPEIDAQRAVNLYPEAVESGTGKNRAALIGTPGTDQWATAPKAPIRALWSGDGGNRMFCVAGDTLYEVDSSGTFTSRGAVGDDATHTPAKIIPNGNSILVISAGDAYIDNGAGVISPAIPERHTAPGDLTPVAGTTDSASGGDFIGGHFIVTRPDSKQFNISELYDGSTWDGLDFNYKVSYPDNLVTMLADHGDLWLFGTDTAEVWQHTGNANFPFERDLGAQIQQGNIAPHATVRLAGGVGFLGGDSRGSVVAYRAKGYQPVRVSTHAIEAAWKAYGTSADAIGFSYQDNGHEFWVIYFPTGNATWVYDVTTGLWHERSWWNGSSYQAHRARCHCEAFGMHLVGDRITGDIHRMASDIYTDNGVDIKRLRTAPHVSDDDEPLFYNGLEIDMLTGAGTTTATMTYSDDGGHTWSTPKTVSGGAFLAFKTRVIWRRLGRSRDRIFSVEIVSDAEVAIVDALLKVTPGTSTTAKAA